MIDGSSVGRAFVRFERGACKTRFPHPSIYTHITQTMNEYKVSNPNSRTVSVGRDEQGNQQATVSQNGSGKVTAGAASVAGATAHAAALANIENMQRQAAFLAERINARDTKVDPITGELPFARTEEERKRDMLALRQLNDSIEYQRQRAGVVAVQAHVAEANRITQAQAEQAQRDAIEKRAHEIAVEAKAQERARKLTIR